jgi:hypothetical protein
MMNFKTSLLILLCMLGQLYAGQIYTYDVELSPPNAGEVKTLKLWFSIESGLGMNKVLNIKFPISVGTSPKIVLTKMGDATAIVKSKVTETTTVIEL